VVRGYYLRASQKDITATLSEEVAPKVPAKRQAQNVHPRPCARAANDEKRRIALENITRETIARPSAQAALGFSFEDMRGPSYSVSLRSNFSRVSEKKIQTTLLHFQMFISIAQSVTGNGKNTTSSCSSTDYAYAVLNMT